MGLCCNFCYKRVYLSPMANTLRPSRASCYNLSKPMGFTHGWHIAPFQGYF